MKFKDFFLNKKGKNRVAKDNYFIKLQIDDETTIPKDGRKMKKKGEKGRTEKQVNNVICF